MTFAPLLFLLMKEEVVASVEVRGPSPDVKLETQVGGKLDAKTIENDVRRLWNAGRFEDILVEARDSPEGTAIVFRLTRANEVRLREVRVDPPSSGVKVIVTEGTILDARSTHQIAAEAKRQLQAQGYRDADVKYDVIPVAARIADLRLTVRTGDPVKVKHVSFSGDSVIREKELRASLRELHSRRILLWRTAPAYSTAAADADARRVLSRYLSRGYFDATASASPIDDGVVRFVIDSGPRYDAPPLDCRGLFAERRAAERQGVMDFSARVKIQAEGDRAEVRTSTKWGSPYRVGRIRFFGNHHYSDSAIRGYFLLNEAAPFDEYLLRKSLARLNRSNWFEPVTESDVAIFPHEAAGTADITVRLTEKKRGKWSLSGPVGPVSIGGPLQASLNLRMARYTFSIALVALAHPVIPAIPVKRFYYTTGLARSGTGWLSGISFAPQLGWQATAIGYATAQLRQRLTPLVAGDRGLIPELPAEVETQSGEKTMFCEAPPPRFSALRSTAGIALQIAGSIPGF